MIPPSINATFQFIEYLHSNIEKFNQYNELIKQIEILIHERSEIIKKREIFSRGIENYKIVREIKNLDKMELEIQKNITEKSSPLYTEIRTRIIDKAKELGITIDDYGVYIPCIFSDIELLIQDFTPEDVKEVFKYKKKYYEYREGTHGSFLVLGGVFGGEMGLDNSIKPLFDYFKDEEQQNEFAPFEDKDKVVVENSIKELVKKVFNGFKVLLFY